MQVPTSAYTGLSFLKNARPAGQATALPGPKTKQPLSEEDKAKVQKGLEAAVGKLRAGKNLSATEMALLREHSPVYYQKALAIQEERAQYRAELEQCRSKQDVEDLHARRQMQLQSQRQHVQNTPMAKEDKEKALEFTDMRAAATKEETRDYKQTPQYRRLPPRPRKEGSQAASAPAAPENPGPAATAAAQSWTRA